LGRRLATEQFSAADDALSIPIARMTGFMYYSGMFGLGPLEIALIAGCLILFFGVPRAARMLGRLLRTWRRVEEVRGQLRAPFSLKTFLLRKGRDYIAKD